MFMTFLDLFGVAVFAISGALAAGRRGMDFLGTFVCASVTAVGGGTLRDLLINRHPIFWFSNSTYLYIIIGSVIVTMLYTRRFPLPHYSLQVADALGLAVFGISGAHVAEQAGLAPLVVIFMGTITAAAGGVIRDLLCSTVPMVFQRDIYVISVIVGLVGYVALQRLGIASNASIVIGGVIIIVIRLLAIFFHLHLPLFRLRQADQG